MKFKECFTFDWEGDPRRPYSIRGVFLLWIFDMEYRVVVHHRLARYFQKSKNRFFRRYGQLLKNKLARVPGIEINANSELGQGIRFCHPMGVVIGAGSRIGANVKIYNGVTLGAKGFVKDGENLLGENRYPTIEDGVVIFPGARIIGGITIGKNSVVGANAVVINSFPANSVIGGIPARLINLA